jgi:hypothetical protein
MKFLIPSLGRADSIGRSIDFLGKENTLVYVNESEGDEYAKFISKKNIRPMVDVKGIAHVRKLMYDDNVKEDYVCQIDDDFSGLIYRHDGKSKFETISDPDHIRAVIANSYQVAVDIGTPLFSFDGTENPTLYSVMTITKFFGALPSFTGIIPKLMGSINYDTRFTVRENQDLAFQCKYYRRYIFFDYRYSVRFHSPYFQKGGGSTNRNTKIMNECGELLFKKYGKACVKRAGKVPYTIHFPF